MFYLNVMPIQLGANVADELSLTLNKLLNLIYSHSYDIQLRKVKVKIENT